MRQKGRRREVWEGSQTHATQQHQHCCIVESNTFPVAEHHFSSTSLTPGENGSQCEKGREASDARRPPASWYLTRLY